jgi:hypothetical protein
MLYDDEPEVWRKRAEEVRVQAEDMADLDARRVMLGIAESYERRAEYARAYLIAQMTDRAPRGR